MKCARWLSIFAFGCGVCLFVASATCAQKFLKVDDVVSMNRITSVQMSPDGSFIAYTVEQPNDEAHSKEPPKTALFVLSVADGTSWQLGGPARASSPKWSPNSKTLAYLSARPGDQGTQIYLLNVADRHEQRLTGHSTSVQSFSWSPNGSVIAYLSTPPESERERRQTELGYDEIHVGPGPDQEGRNPELWRVSLADGQSR